MTATAQDFDFQIGRGDTLFPFDAVLRDANGDPIDLSLATRVDFHLGRRRGQGEALAALAVDAEAQVLDAPAGLVRYAWQDGDTDVAGRFLADWMVTFPSGRLTVPNGQKQVVLIVDDVG